MRPIDGMQRQAVDLFRTGDISLKNALHYGTIQLYKLEFDGQFDKNIVGATINRPRAANCRPYNTG